MGECGCTFFDKRYKFPGPGKSFYMLALCGACKDCDVAPGITIELCRPGDADYDYYQDADYYHGHLKFAEWPDCSGGVAIVTGLRKSEFVKATTNHLVGIGQEMMGDGDVIDRSGAEVILEEMFEEVDTQIKPKLVTPIRKAVSVKVGN